MFECWYLSILCFSQGFNIINNVETLIQGRNQLGARVGRAPSVKSWPPPIKFGCLSL